MRGIAFEISDSVGYILSPLEAQQPLFEIISVKSRVTESNSSWTGHAWVLVIRNLTPRTLQLDALIEFHDADGFVIDHDSEYGLVVGPHEEKRFMGYHLIDASVAPNVASVFAIVERST